MLQERKYFKPKSITWYAGLVPILLGLFLATEPLHELTLAVEIVGNMTGGLSPYALINGGIGFIGLRGAIR